MEKPSDSKNSSISVNYFLNSAAYSGLFSLLSVILTGQVSATSSLCVGLALGVLSLFSRGSTVFIGGLIERSSTVSASFFWIWLCWDLVSHWLILLSEGISSLE